MSKVTQSARNQPCTLRIPGVCNWNIETTVFAHTGSGTAKRRTDKGCYACSDCHDAIDGRTRVFLSDDPEKQARLRRARLEHIREAERETTRLLAEQGLAA